MFCGKCGTENEADFKFCKKCGNHLAEQGGGPPQQDAIDVSPAFRDYLKQYHKLKPDEGILAVANLKSGQLINFLAVVCHAIVVVGILAAILFLFSEDGMEEAKEVGIVPLVYLMSACYLFSCVLFVKQIYYHIFCPSKAKSEQLLVVTTERLIGTGFVAVKSRGFSQIDGVQVFSWPQVVSLNAPFDTVSTIEGNIKKKTIFKNEIFVTTKSGYFGFFAIENKEEILRTAQKEILRSKS